MYECSSGCQHVYHWDCYRSGLRNHVASLHNDSAPTRGWPPGELPCLTEACNGRIIHLLVTEGSGESLREHWDVNRQAWDEAQEQQRLMELAAQKRMQRDVPQKEEDDWRRWQRLAEEEAAAADDDGLPANDSDASDASHAEVASSLPAPNSPPPPDFATLQLRPVARDEAPDLQVEQPHKVGLSGGD